MKPVFKRLIQHGPRQAYSRTKSFFAPPQKSGNVLMLHTGRSGSTLLGNMLDQNPDVFWDGETLEKMFHRMSRRRKVGVDHLYGEVRLNRALAEIDSRMRRLAGGRYFGIEVQDYHIKMLQTDGEQFLAGVKRFGFTKFVVLKRNPIRKLISHIAATERKQHHAKAREKVNKAKIRIDPDKVYVGHRFTKIERVLGQYESFFSEFDRLLASEDCLRLRYERDIEQNPLVANEKICRFIGAEPHDPAITLKKTTERNLADVVENYDEIRQRLLAGPFRDKVLEMEAEPLAGQQA